MRVRPRLQSLMTGLAAFVLALSFSARSFAQTNVEALFADRPDAMMIMDFSGSMWGQVNGRAKYDVANDIIQQRFANWSDSLNLGVLAYGHRRRGDCQDIELAFRPGEASPRAIREWLGKQQPSGKTPLGGSLTAAANYFESRGQEANLIILSDGIESCGQDPCRVIQDLHAGGAQITAHVIGFDLDEESTNALRCIADLTGGSYVGADRADELAEGFRKAVQAIADRNSETEDALRQSLEDSLNALNDAAKLLDDANRRAAENAAMLEQESRRADETAALLEDEKRRAAQAEALLGDARDEIARLSDVLADRDATIAELAAALADCDDEVARLNAALAEALQTIEDQAETIEDQAAIIAQLEKDLRQALNDSLAALGDAAIKLEAANARGDENASMLADAYDELGRLNDILSDRDATIVELATALSACEDETVRLNAALEDALQTMGDQAETIAQLEKDLRQALNDSLLALQDAADQLDAANLRADENGAMLADALDELARLTSVLSDRDAALADLAAALSDCEDEVARLSAALAGAEGTIADLANTIADQTSTIGTLNDQVGSLEDQVAALQNQLDERNDLIDDLSDQMESLEAEGTEMSTQLAKALRNRQITVSSLDFGGFEGVNRPIDIAALVSERNAYLTALQQLRQNLGVILEPMNQAQAIAENVPQEASPIATMTNFNEVKVLLATAVEGELPDLQWSLRGTQGDALGRRGFGAGARIDLPDYAGTFEITLRLPGFEAVLNVESDPNNPQSRDIPLNVGRLMLRMPESQFGPFFTYVKSSKGEDVARAAMETEGYLYLKPGIYTVENRSDGAEDIFEVQIYAGKETAVPLRF